MLGACGIWVQRLQIARDPNLEHAEKADDKRSVWQKCRKFQTERKGELGISGESKAARVGAHQTDVVVRCPERGASDGGQQRTWVFHHCVDSRVTRDAAAVRSSAWRFDVRHR
jgi:hypothetical protein